MRKSSTLEALFPEVRSKILAATFGQSEKDWYLTELAGFLEVSPSSLQREVDALSKAEILEQWRDGRRLYFKANTGSPVFSELKGLFDKTAGMLPILRQHLEPFGEAIAVALVFGSVARSEDTSESDIDLLIVGSVGLADLVPALRSMERALGRPVNPSVYSREEFRSKVQGRDHFLCTVLAGAKEFVRAGEDELAAILGEG